MRTGVDLVLFIAWASVGVVALGIWFVATLRLSRRRLEPKTARVAAVPVESSTPTSSTATVGTPRPATV